MQFRNFLYTSYWLTQPNLATKGVETVYLVILLGLVLGGIVALLVRRTQTVPALIVLMNRYTTCGISMGLIGLLLFYFREQHVFFLGWRVWFLLWFVVLAAWLGRLITYHIRRVPKIIALAAERASREKYLPKGR